MYQVFKVKLVKITRTFRSTSSAELGKEGDLEILSHQQWRTTARGILPLQLQTLKTGGFVGPATGPTGG